MTDTSTECTYTDPIRGRGSRCLPRPKQSPERASTITRWCAVIEETALGNGGSAGLPRRLTLVTAVSTHAGTVRALREKLNTLRRPEGGGSSTDSGPPTVSLSSDGRWVTVSGNERRQVATDTSDYTPTVVERSGPAIRTALLTYAPERCVQFEAELRSALALAAEDLDLSGPQAVLVHWQAVAMMAANPLTDEEREQIERAKAGDFSGLLTWHQGENGRWVRP